MQKVLKLINETIFPDLNRVRGVDKNYVSNELPLHEFKYKNLKELQTIRPEQQMTYIMGVLTGLTVRDLDELSSDDATELIAIVHKIMAKHIELGKNLLNSIDVSQEDKVQILQESLHPSH